MESVCSQIKFVSCFFFSLTDDFVFSRRLEKESFVLNSSYTIWKIFKLFSQFKDRNFNRKIYHIYGFGYTVPDVLLEGTTAGISLRSSARIHNFNIFVAFSYVNMCPQMFL